jgi:hypothetical protein
MCSHDDQRGIANSIQKLMKSKCITSEYMMDQEKHLECIERMKTKLSLLIVNQSFEKIEFKFSSFPSNKEQTLTSRCVQSLSSIIWECFSK